MRRSLRNVGRSERGREVSTCGLVNAVGALGTGSFAFAGILGRLLVRQMPEGVQDTGEGEVGGSAEGGKKHRVTEGRCSLNGSLLSRREMKVL